MKKLSLGVIGSHPTVKFAADELKKYLLLMDHNLTVEMVSVSSSDEREHILWLGMDDQLCSHLPKVDDSRYDDAIAISVNNGAGYITGTNERSVLIAVYRFLTELGCRWVRPGKKGERIPQKDLGEIHVALCEKGDYRHRGVCIEGACSRQNLIDIVDYLPKVSLNTYFIQSMTPTQYISRWYELPEVSTGETSSASPEEISSILCSVTQEMKKRSILDHRGGHGWAQEAFGKKMPQECSEDLREMDDDLKMLIAQTNGKRQLFLKHIDTTNLCYSNPNARNGISDAVVNYCKNNPNADTVHVWLADMPNNHCECKSCDKRIPADWYVILLNEIDQKLSEAKLETKIVFLLYYDLLWAPITQQLNNSARFTLMFAPASREYGKSYGEFLRFDREIPPYQRNKLEMPKDLSENIAHLRNWQAFFKGDSFAYEYHLMWAYCGDMGFEKCAENLHGDIKDLKKIGLNGFISAQPPKTFFPSALAFNIMAKTLWDTSCDYEKERDDYYAHAFGKDANQVHEYLYALSHLIDLYDQPPFGDDTAPYGPFCSDYPRLESLRIAFDDIIARNLNNQDATASDWALLTLHSQFISMLSEVLPLRESKKDEEAHQAFDRLRDFLSQNGAALKEVYDVFEAPSILERKIFKQK